MDKDNLKTRSFKIEALREILKLHFIDSKTRIMDDTLLLVAEVVRTMTAEAILRACRQAKVEEQSVIQVEHVEKILPQLMLDFI
ncbi:centromere protein X-like [Periplaneta americana]|uniref:centromere protein X-like n=1 Tax=Periplaneta americana TaxID=6978 RepID=UPI0037E7EB77